MICPSRVLSEPSSESTRAVIPIDVAVSAAPTKIAVRRLVTERHRDGISPGEGQHHPRERHHQRGRAHAEELVQVGLEAHFEEEKDDADLGEQVDPLGKRDQAEHRRTEEDARQQLAEYGRLADPLGEVAQELRAEKRRGERQEERPDVGVFQGAQTPSGPLRGPTDERWEVSPGSSPT